MQYKVLEGRNLSIIAGGTGVSSNLTIGRVNFDNGLVTLAATGAPAGVSTTITPTSTTASAAVVAFTATAATVPGVYPITITASGSGILNASVQITLTVTGPASIAISFSRNPVSIARGASGPNSVVITRTNIVGAVLLAVSGLPADVTGTFGANPTGTNGSVLTLNVGPAAPLGAFVITVSATAAGINGASGIFTLNVTAAPP